MTKEWKYKKTKKSLTDIYKEEILDTRLVISKLNDDKNDISFSEKANRDIEKELQDNQLEKI